MKSFKDLVFKPKEFAGGVVAQLYFTNGYGISVITEGYGDFDHPYEIAVLKDDDICYTSHITDDVIGWLTEIEVSNIMAKIQAL